MHSSSRLATLTDRRLANGAGCPCPSANHSGGPEASDLSSRSIAPVDLAISNSSDLLAELHCAPASPMWLRCCSVVASFAATGLAGRWLTGFAAVASFDCPPDQRQHCRLSAPSRTGPVTDRWPQLRLLCLCFLISFLPLEVELAFFRPAGFLTLKPVPTDNKASVVPTRWSIGYSTWK